MGLLTCREEESKDAGDICSPHIPAAAIAQCMPAFQFGHVMAPGTPRAGPAQRGLKRGIKSIAALGAAVVQVPPVQVRHKAGTHCRELSLTLLCCALEDPLMDLQVLDQQSALLRLLALCDVLLGCY